MKSLIDFFKGVVELLSVQAESGFSGKEENPESEKVLDAYKWFLEQIKDEKNTRVQINRDPWFQPGKIYVFKYNAKYKDRLEVWDKHPIVLALGKMQYQGSICNVGINISWYPPQIRKEIINRIRKLYAPMYEGAIKSKGQLANQQMPVYIDLFALKMALDPLGFSWAIRNYLPEGILQPKYCICYEDWDKAIRLDQPKVFPEIEGRVTLFKFYDDFKKYVLNYNNNKAERQRRTEEAKKQNKFKFIK
jgi:hypothetical protein